MKITKGFEAQQVLAKFQHDLIHSEELLRLYPDLSIVAMSTADTLHEVEYFSSKIATEVDNCEFIKEATSTYLYIHTVQPYKNVRINCTKCDGVIKVNSNPHSIPIFLEHEVSFRKDFTINCFVYEDLLKAHQFSSKVLADTQLYILSKLDEHAKLNNKLDLFGLSNSIKLLLPFT